MEALTHNNSEDFREVANDFLNADPVNHSATEPQRNLTTVDSALRGLHSQPS